MVTKHIHLPLPADVLQGVHAAARAVPRQVAALRRVVLVQVARRVEGTGSPHVEVLRRILRHGSSEGFRSSHIEFAAVVALVEGFARVCNLYFSILSNEVICIVVCILVIASMFAVFAVIALLAVAAIKYRFLLYRSLSFTGLNECDIMLHGT